MKANNLNFKNNFIRSSSSTNLIRWSKAIAVIFLVSASLLFSNRFIENVSANGSVAFTAVEDAFIKSSTPVRNYGSSANLDLENDSKIMRSLLRFNVSGLPADAVVTSVTLRLFVPSNGSATGGDIWQVNGPWTESTVTWATAPAIGAKLGSMPNPVSAGAWAQTSVPISYVNGNGTFDFYLTTSNTTDAVFYSSTRSSTPPTLLVSFLSSLVVSTSTPSPTLVPPTGTPTPTAASLPPTSTATPTALPRTSTPTATSLPPTATSTSAPASGDPFIAAAGDIACDPASSSFNGGAGTSSSCHMLATARLISAIKPAAVVTLGDTQYYCGSLSAFNQSYSLSWGAFKPITHPSIGNHEYLTSGGTGCDATNAGAAGYFNYFGSAAGLTSQGYYSYDLGAWHVVVLNSNCSDAGGCNSTSPQYLWLAQDLQAHPNTCTLAYWHIPLYSSGGRANNNTQALYQLLYNRNADLVLTGHDHTYERFAPQDANGNLDLVRGIREFVVGTGGSNHTTLATLAPNSQVFNQDTFGVLKVTLHPTSYDWQFVPEAGKTFTDSGTTNCH